MLDNRRVKVTAIQLEAAIGGDDANVAACERIDDSFLCWDEDGEMQNAFCLAGLDGPIGRHDKDEGEL